MNEITPPLIRRRLFDIEPKERLNNILDYDITSPCEYATAGELVAEVCDYLTELVLEDIFSETNFRVRGKDKDNLYYYFVDEYGYYISKIYKLRCGESLKESKKTYIITESQYKSITVSNKLIETFQTLIDNKLKYIRGFCDETLPDQEYSGDVGFVSWNNIETIDSIKVDDVNMMSSSGVDISGRMRKPYPSIYVKITINYSDIKQSIDFDDLVYDLKSILKKSASGLPIVIDYGINNLYKNNEW